MFDNVFRNVDLRKYCEVNPLNNSHDEWNLNKVGLAGVDKAAEHGVFRRPGVDYKSSHQKTCEDSNKSQQEF